ncbi:FAD-binding-3 domain-containing protein [Favolaschia claudopus]|uniref:FAD-binding-3 domain-containing protein n=1 Tax=Favolaschia claudopus TaxID=2862362 RepID=A0AAW0A7G3_9AGAR
MADPSVLIVGAGPSGLVLALVLLENGVSVRIIDKEPAHRPGTRGAGVQPRTLELYDILDVLPGIQEVGEPMRPLIARYERGEIEPTAFVTVAEIVQPTPDTPHPNTYFVRQDGHEAALRSYLEKLGCSVELGSELRSLEQSPDHVVAVIEKTDSDGNKTEETTKFDWLVGTDGAHSVVRKLIGVNYLGETKPTYIALGDVVVEAGVDPALWHLWEQPSTFMMLRASGVEDRTMTFFYSGRPEHLAKQNITREEFVEKFYEITGRHDVKFGATPWLSNYRANIRMADNLQVGRVFLAGDAAHCHSPTGGQGLNSGVQDAVNLGWKLALVQKGLASQSILATYTKERLRIIAHMLKFTTELYKASLDRIPGGQKTEDASWDRSGDVQMLGVNYSGSAIILQDAEAVARIQTPYSRRPIESGPVSVQAAFRAPDAPGLVLTGSGDVKTLFSIFSVAAHTVLIFGSEAGCGDRVAEIVEKLPQRVARAVRILPQGETACSSSSCETVFEDRAGHAYTGYGVPFDKLTIVVVRPDGVVGAVVSGAEGVERYFTNIAQV